MSAPGVLAISATTLQGIRVIPELEPLLDEVRRAEPLAVLGEARSTCIASRPDAEGQVVGQLPRSRS